MTLYRYTRSKLRSIHEAIEEFGKDRLYQTGIEYKVRGFLRERWTNWRDIAEFIVDYESARDYSKKTVGRINFKVMCSHLNGEE